MTLKKKLKVKVIEAIHLVLTKINGILSDKRTKI